MTPGLDEEHSYGETILNFLLDLLSLSQNMGYSASCDSLIESRSR